MLWFGIALNCLVHPLSTPTPHRHPRAEPGSLGSLTRRSTGKHVAVKDNALELLFRHLVDLRSGVGLVVDGVLGHLGLQYGV